MIEENGKSVVQQFVPFGMMVPVKEQPVEEKKADSFGFLPSLIWAGAIIFCIWLLCYGWEVLK